jgi:GWxTD domain-containing protein
VRRADAPAVPAAVLAIALAAVVVPFAAHAKLPLPPATSHGDVRFVVDAAGFASAGAETRQEIYLQIPASELRFKRSADGLLARIEVEFSFQDTASGETILHKTMLADLPAASEAEAKDPAEMHVLESEFLLAPGHYELEIRIEDLQKRGSVFPLFLMRRNESGKVSLSLDVRAFTDSQLRVSDLEFAREVSDTVAASEDDPFQKGNLSVVPCPDRLYGLLIPEVALYFEIYDPRGVGEHGEGVALTTEIREPGGPTLMSQTETLSLATGTRWAKTMRFDLSQLPAGHYAASIVLEKGETGERVQASGTFDVVWTLFSWNKSLDELLEDMASVASSADRDILEKLSSGEREIFLQQFWARLDPTPDTARNEALEEHYQRIRLADRVFRGRVRGSRSDRGRIFVKFGEPDEITTGFATDEFIGDLPFLRRDQFDMAKEGRAKGGMNYENKAYETWSYDQRGHPIGHSDHGGTGLGMRFVFVDLSGYGDFRLVHTTEHVQ